LLSKCYNQFLTDTPTPQLYAKTYKCSHKNVHTKRHFPLMATAASMSNTLDCRCPSLANLITWAALILHRVGQNRMYAPYTTVHLMISLPNYRTYTVCIYMYIWFWPTLLMNPARCCTFRVPCSHGLCAMKLSGWVNFAVSSIGVGLPLL